MNGKSLFAWPVTLLSIALADIQNHISMRSYRFEILAGDALDLKF